MLLLAALLVQAATSSAPLDSLHDTVVAAIRNCPKAAAGETVVCARDRGFSEKFRIQKLDPRFETPPALNLDITDGIDTGLPGGCNNVGQAGAMGCSLRDYREWGAEKKIEKAKGRKYAW